MSDSSSLAGPFSSCVTSRAMVVNRRPPEYGLWPQIGSDRCGRDRSPRDRRNRLERGRRVSGMSETDGHDERPTRSGENDSPRRSTACSARAARRPSSPASTSTTTPGRGVPLPGLRDGPVRGRDEVRVRLRLAGLLRRRGGVGDDDDRHEPRDAPHRSPVCELRLAPRPRVRRRSRAHRQAVLHQLGRDEIQRGVIGLSESGLIPPRRGVRGR